MVATLRAMTVTGFATGSTNWTATKPTIVAGDLVTVACLSNNGTATYTTGLAGLNHANGSPEANGCATFEKIADASDAAAGTIAITRGTNTAGAGIVFIASWQNAAGVAEVNHTSGTGTAVALGGVTAAGANTCLATQIAKVTTTAGAFNAPPAGTQGPSGTASGTALVYSSATETIGAGASGTRTWSYTGSSASRGLLMAINPATEQSVAPTGIASAAVAGTPTVAPGAVAVAPTGIGSTAAAGTPSVSRGAVTAAPSGIGSSAAVGDPAVTPGPASVVPTGISPTASVGTPAVAPDAVGVAPSGIAPSSSVGSPEVAPGTVDVAPTGVGSTAAVGAPEVSVDAEAEAAPASIDPTSSVGTPTVTPGDVDVDIAGIETTAQVGTPTVLQIVPQPTPSSRTVTGASTDRPRRSTATAADRTTTGADTSRLSAAHHTDRTTT